MAWFGDGLPSLSNLKGQISNFTKEVLSEGIVDEIDERTAALNEANQRCVELQELLETKDAENGSHQDDDTEGFFWDPVSTKNRNSKNQIQTRQLQEQLAQATMRIRDLETELKRVQMVNNSSLKDDLSDGHQTGEFLRAKQDMVNRIIQMEEKSREAERNTKRAQPDETALINDFRTVLSKLNSLEKQDLVRSALKALETENEKRDPTDGQEKCEKSDFDEKFQKPDVKSGFDESHSDSWKRHDGFVEPSNNREAELYKKIEELQEENKRLFASVEELDQQHEESIQKLLSLKEEIEKKHQCLQNAYEQLYVDYNQAQDKVIQLEGTLTNNESTKRVGIEIATVSCSCQTVLSKNDTEDRVVQTDDLRKEESIDELIGKVKDILKNASVESEAGESIFEAVAKQYIDAKWKKEVLEKKVAELNRELRSSAETKESLRMECDDMQTHIDTLVLEIQDLKLNLPSIPEASEERVASLESETESLHEQLEQIRAENESLRKENARLRGIGFNEARFESRGSGQHGQHVQHGHGHALGPTPARTKKPTKLEDIPECVEETDSPLDNLNRKLHVTLDENDQLLGKIDDLECSNKALQEQLKALSEKDKDFMESYDRIEALRLDVENTKRELAAATSNGDQLENSLAVLREANREMEKENEQLSRKNDQLETEISKWREMALEKEDDHVLNNLEEQLGKVTGERDDLEYDILNMRKELDEAFDRINVKDDEIAKLSQDCEALMKERHSLMEQILAVQDESNDKIDLVNTEKSLLEQEQQELKEGAANREKELSEIVEQLREAEEKYTTSKNLVSSYCTKIEELESRNEQLRNELEREEESAKELLRLSKDNENLRALNEIVRSKCVQLEQEIADLQARSNEPSNHEKERDDTDDDERARLAALLEERSHENERLIGEIAEMRSKLQASVEGNAESADMARQTIESLSHLVREKDEEMNRLKATVDLAKSTAEISDSFAVVKNERDELVRLVTAKHNESLQYHEEIQRLTRLLNEQMAQIQSLIAERDGNSLKLSEKDAELLRTRNELQAVQQHLTNIETPNTEISEIRETCGIVEHFRLLAETAILNEKCNALEAALIQEQSNYRILQHQLVESKNKEANAEKELERLRTHLVEIESTYTEEALIVEEARQELEAKLQQAEEKVKHSSTAYTSANIRANQQVETLQQQMALIVQQRDDIQNKLSSAENKILSQSASLTNLQIVLEQFQRDKEKDIGRATERLRAKLNESYKRQEELANDIANLKEQLTEAKEGLQAASRLSEQLDKKTERIEQLNEEVNRLTNLEITADQRIEEARQSGEGKVDKTLIKNLLLGYLTASTVDKSSVLRVFSTILDFNEVERDKTGLNSAVAQNGWFSRLSGGSHIPNKDQEASLTAAFVRFLESESIPKPQLPALPIQTSSLQKHGHSRQHSTSSTQSTLLLSNVNLPTFPDFVPARNTGSILKEVLKDS
ncbi:uncharacterized protein LOC143213413 isoform X2 [Lasioglossum baleicum]|uniref:uncharacterized protein LOC143213413 isoform X2 n=1 Tax=Lasioglossum baleicum TaxID=434251 RepID=UPI003FCC7617